MFAVLVSVGAEGQINALEKMNGHGTWNAAVLTAPYGLERTHYIIGLDLSCLAVRKPHKDSNLRSRQHTHSLDYVRY